MPQPLRLEDEGAICHVINRGDRREPLFRSDAVRKRFLQTLGEACAKTDWQEGGEAKAEWLVWE